ncbi:hypothetical protein RJE46_05570 [Cedecea neteri]|uniref:hypothetical protein n=1 Tax=Cedecea neteri TaxID=158822 RepID=UPI002892E725|nr:hypothetical protein [Cedecea neteri]WNJ80709.1 hypothetical protein RJE46_05570 [Cedecea neteri]
MEIYKDINNDSGVRGYELGNTFIKVWFDGTARDYTYSYASAGADNVEKMKKLAVSGDGLNAFINHFVKFKYER